MAFTNAAKESAATNVTGLGAYISLHTADPGTTGASEATGGGYARQITTWTAGSSDGVVNGSQVTFDLPAGTYTHIGIWNASTGPTFIGATALSSNAVLSGAGQLLVTPTVTVA